MLLRCILAFGCLSVFHHIDEYKLLLTLSGVESVIRTERIESREAKSSFCLISNGFVVIPL